MTVLSLQTGRAESARRAVSLIFLVNGAFFATWAVNIPGVRDALSLSEAQIGGALLAIGLGALITMPLTGGWTARYGSGPVTRVAVVACMLSLALPFLAPGYLGVVLGLTVMGAANGSLDVAMNAQGVTVEQALKRPVLSRLHAYFSLGGVLGAALGTLLVGRVPMLTHVLLVVGVTTVAGVLAGRLMLPDPPVTQTQEAGQAAQPSRRRMGISSAALLLGLLCFLGMLSEGANYDWAALYFRDVLGQAGGNAGIGYTAFAVTMTLGRWFGDLARTRLGDEAIVRVGAAVAGLGLGIALLAQGPVVATIGFALSGLGLSNVVPVLYGAAGHALAGRGIAQVATLGYGGFLLGPPLIGFVAQEVGLRPALGVALAGAVLVALLGGSAFALVRRRIGAGPGQVVGQNSSPS
ncbi:MFS transporter [Deinococcus marmoris]|uniref:Transport protein n=1 Tax=Deinococcus marmoris TaxID=249408 RepID=A0A1U7NSI2_9DEIO|nr:MFS transporter [Deinococcus marmoris]OLV15883.1 transport protein [Deinococcus marmoris]